MFYATTVSKIYSGGVIDAQGKPICPFKKAILSIPTVTLFSVTSRAEATY